MLFSYINMTSKYGTLFSMQKFSFKLFVMSLMAASRCDHLFLFLFSISVQLQCLRVFEYCSVLFFKSLFYLASQPRCGLLLLSNATSRINVLFAMQWSKTSIAKMGLNFRCRLKNKNLHIHS